MHHIEQPKAQNVITSCFISAPAGTDLSILIRVLHEHHIEVIDLADFGLEALTITEKIADGIRHADLIIAVLSSKTPNANVLFELGCAYGLGKKILIIASEGSSVPSDLAGVMYIRAMPNNHEALTFALENVLSAPIDIRSSTKQARQESKPLGDTAELLLRQLEAPGIRLEEGIAIIVQSMLDASGISTRAQPRFGDARPDFAIWVEELEPYLGNPLIVEVKIRLTNRQEASILASRLMTYLSHGNSHAALIFALEISRVAERELAQYPQIFLFDLREFLGRLRTESFGKLIRNERNMRFHGTLA